MTQAHTPPTAETGAPAAHDENQLIAERREKLKALREAQKRGEGVAFPNDFKPADKAAELFARYGEATKEALEAEPLMKSQNAEDGTDFSDTYMDALDQLGEYYPDPGWKRHQLLGSPLPEQSDPRYDAVVVTSFGKQHLSREEWQSHAERIQMLARQWRLLWQVDLSDWGGELSEGTVYFLIRDSDLAERRFDQVVAVYQQT